MALHEDYHDIGNKDLRALTEKQKQLLYECEEERMVVKACFRKMMMLRRKATHTSWHSAESSNMCLD